jgi:hypothetical protein
MKKLSSKRLVLNRETLVRLNVLEEVVGGANNTGATCLPVTNVFSGCPCDQGD